MGGQRPAVRASVLAITSPLPQGKGKRVGSGGRPVAWAPISGERPGDRMGLGQSPRVEGSGANSSRQELEAGWTEEVGRNESSSLFLFLA